jgi:acylphosphatase
VKRTSVHVHVIISGDVQGVGFRAWVIRQARELGVLGWVKNREDGAVETVAEGTRKDLEEFVQRCRRGPGVAWVEKVDVRWEEATGEYDDFDVVY